MPKENKTLYAILGLLSHEPLTGYDIKKKISVIHYFWDAGFGQIYPALKELESEGMVTKQSFPGQRGRKIYTITAQGRKKLAQWLQVPASQENVRYEILLKLFFSSLIPASESVKNIVAFKNRNQINLQTLKRFERNLVAALPESPDHTYYLLTVLFGKYVYQAYLKWADEAIEILKNLEGE